MKQSLGIDEVQGWSARAVERQVPIVVVVHALVVAATYSQPRPTTTPQLPSFARVLTRLRMEIWTERLSDAFACASTPEKILDQLERALLTAA